jgi:hypothetical protein
MPPENAAEETSIRDDFEASIAAIENEDEGAVTVETAATAEEEKNAIKPEDIFSDDGEKEAETKAKAAVEAEADKALAKEPDDKPAAADGDDAKSGLGDDEQSLEGAKAPESWSPSAREGWGDLPDDVKQQITKRENEINKSLNEGAVHRKTGAAFQGIADRYAQVIAAEGASDALTGVEELVKTVATLRMGSPAQKAEKIAGFIAHYGIDINTLDDILSAQVSGQPNVDPNDPVAAMINERFKPMDDFLAQQGQTQRQAQFQKNQDAINEVVTFKQDAEFYNDVQHDMADMVEMAERRGVNMPLQEAYDKACALNPQIAGVLAKRVADEKLIGNGKDLEAKRDASSSIAGKQAGEVVLDTENMSLRQTLNAAVDAQVG